MCNLAPDNRSVTEVLLPSDSAFLSIHALFSLSSGLCLCGLTCQNIFFTQSHNNFVQVSWQTQPWSQVRSRCQIQRSKFYQRTILNQVESDEEKTLAASILVFSLVFGLFLGAASSYVWVRLLWSLCSLTWETRVNLMRTYLSHLMNEKTRVRAQFSLYFHLTKTAKYLYQDFKVSIIVGHI